jgi:hypothetical protein
MLPASSTSEQTLLTRDVNGLENCEANFEQVSSLALATCLISNLIFETIYMKTQHVVADDNVQHPTQASEEAYILDKDKTHSSSLLMAGSTADMTLVPPSPSPSAENITNENDCKLSTLVLIQDLQCLTV